VLIQYCSTGNQIRHNQPLTSVVGFGVISNLIKHVKITFPLRTVVTKQETRKPCSEQRREISPGDLKTIQTREQEQLRTIGHSSTNGITAKVKQNFHVLSLGHVVTIFVSLFLRNDWNCCCSQSWRFRKPPALQPPYTTNDSNPERESADQG